MYFFFITAGGLKKLFFYPIAGALVMVFKQWGLGLKG
jgi:hypothetical protein